MEINDIKQKYNLNGEVVGYLAEVLEKKGDWRDYEEHKQVLREMNLTPREYERAIKCLIDILNI